MKFGHNLPRNQVPEWASYYIDYKGLKKLIKTAAQEAREGVDPDLAGKSPIQVTRTILKSKQASSSPSTAI